MMIRVAAFLLLSLSFASCSSQSSVGRVTTGGAATLTDPGLAVAVSRVDEIVREEMERNRIPGLAVGIVTVDGLAWGAGYGDTAGGPVTVDTRFRIASVTKPITAAAVLTLVEAGRIDLAAPVTRYLPEFRLAGDTEGITMLRLLSHHGGLVRDIHAGAQGPVSDEVDVLSQLAPLLPAESPGTSYRYSNVGYSVLGRAIAAASGTSYEAYVADSLFGPLGMTRTTPRLPTSPQALDQPATGYQPIGLLGRRHRRVDAMARRDVAAGSAVSTVRDLSAFVAMLLREGVGPDGDRILSSESVAALFTPPDPRRPLDEDLYALGFKIGKLGLPWPDARHGGTLDGYSTLIALVPEKNVGVVVLYNANQPFSRHFIANEALRALAGEKDQSVPAAPADTVEATGGDAEPKAPSAGHYVGVGDFSLHVELDVKARHVELSGQKLSLVPLDEKDTYRIVKRIAGIPFPVAGAFSAESAQLDFATVDGMTLPRITLAYRGLPLHMYFLPVEPRRLPGSVDTPASFAIVPEDSRLAAAGPSRIDLFIQDDLLFADLDAGGITRMILMPAPEAALPGTVFQAVGTGETFRLDGETLYYSGLRFHRL